MIELLSYGDKGWGDELLAGLAITLQLAAVVLPIGLVIGFIFAGISLSENKFYRAIGTVYTTALRGLPELLTLFIIYNGISLLISKIIRIVWPTTPFIQLTPFLAGVIALSMVFGAFAAEVLRGAFQSLNKGEIEAGQAIGFSPRKIFLRIKLPQIWKFALPGLGNLWLVLIKDTALVSVIALNDLMRMTTIAVGITKKPFTFYLIACLLYWIICGISEYLLAYFEKRSQRGVKEVR